MNVLALQGSPRKNDNTQALLQSLLKGMEEVPDIKIESVHLQDKWISPCRSCGSCRKTMLPVCVIKDDMNELYPKFIQADLLVFATPVYWAGMSAQLKLFMDRLYALSKSDTDISNFKGKKIILVMTYGDKDPNPGADLIVRTFEVAVRHFDMEIIHILGVCSGE